MGYKNILDMHCHTANSFDGNHSAMRMCEAASKKGMRSITFTDHCETDIYEKGNFGVAMHHAFVEIAKARSAFEGTLLVNNGIELGEPTYDVETAEKIINRFKYDQVIGSIHNLRGKPDFCDMNYNTEYTDVYALLDEYFEEELLLSQWAKFDTLAHLTYPLRYMVGEYKLDIDISRYSDIIDEILLNVIKNERALEINTSGLRQPIGRTMPDEDIVLRYKQLGGTMITIGSDSHYDYHVGAGIEEGMALAEKCGFSEITLFQKRLPIQIKIE